MAHVSYIFIAFLALLGTFAQAFYSVNYYPGNSKTEIVNKGAFFMEAPDAVQVADIYSRLSRAAPLLKEGIHLCFIGLLFIFV